MADVRYSVIYRGRILEGFEFKAVKENLVRMFSLAEEKAEKVLKSSRAVLKKDADEVTARKYWEALKRAGLDVTLTMSRPEAAPRDAAPAAGPKRPEVSVPVAAAPLQPAERDAQEAAGVAAPSAMVAPVTKVPFEFHGTGSEYFRIWLVNVMLSIITLGIYSPWAKVRRKQYFYGNTNLQGAGFEYLADPVKILKGRAIVVCVFAVQAFLSKVAPVAGSLMSLAILVMLPWVLVRSLTFNARNTALRNIRFGFGGTVREAGSVYVLWPMLGALSLGILFPYVYFRQKKFVVENSSYGTTRFEFNATAGEYYRLFFHAIVPLIAGGAAMAAAVVLLPPAAFLVGLVLYLYLFAFFSVKTTNLLFNSSRLARHRLEATLKIKEYLMLVVTNSIATALTVGLFHPWAKVRTLRYKLENLSICASGDLDSFIAAEQEQVSALCEEMSDFLDFDFGL